MAKKKKSTDINENAFQILQAATGQAPKLTDAPKPIDKNPAAVALGRLGGLKGGKARAKKLSSKERSEIAKKGAASRWKKRQ